MTPDQDAADQWMPARLISPAGVRGAKEQEERATSALLATMSVVPSFGRRILKTIGAPAGTISVHWYNTQRLHGYLDDIPPAECEDAYDAERSSKLPVGNQ